MHLDKPKEITYSNTPEKPLSSNATVIGDKHRSSYSYLFTLLENLEDIEQGAKFHPEGNALYHSLQVFDCALIDSNNPTLWAAALLHDVGKGIDYPNHAHVGADELEGIIRPDICWLIRHHLDLLTHPKRTRSKYQNTDQLKRLESLRKWDLAGRKVDAAVMSIEQALAILIKYWFETRYKPA